MLVGEKVRLDEFYGIFCNFYFVVFLSWDIYLLRLFSWGRVERNVGDEVSIGFRYGIREVYFCCF